jgi:hypothetical protein
MLMGSLSINKFKTMQQEVNEREIIINLPFIHLLLHRFKLTRGLSIVLALNYTFNSANVSTFTSRAGLRRCGGQLLFSVKLAECCCVCLNSHEYARGSIGSMSVLLIRFW